ncbi:hypothetical protein BB560_003951 [Smittium megazygosporum]|uniref:Uncharacterized protein n=1 Tax=Smittium megazygosporum TaxID=133381 RepID=A0A2T9ZAK8_9FUNG|nr:hypothetical protein BB560_003951 [Smittium megazygosporum]
MDIRREELERKRAKLAELRRQREERKQSHYQSSQISSKLSSDKHNLNSLVDSLINSSTDSGLTSRSISRNSDRSETGGLSKPVKTTANDNFDGSESISALPGTLDSRFSKAADLGEKENDSISKFSTFSTVLFDIPPKEKVYYSKEIQVSSELDENDSLVSDKLKNMVPQNEVEKIVSLALEKEQKDREQYELERKQKETLQKNLKEQVTFFTDERKQEIIESTRFAEFFEKSSRVMERAIDEDYDFTVDYTLSQSQKDIKPETRIKHVRDLHADNLCNSRSVTDISWSGKFGELIVTSYNRNALAPNEPDGIVAVWNIHLQNRPEFIFHSPSDVLTVIHSEFNPNMVIGSTYSGQIMIWDTRTKIFPVLKTLSGASGHTQPVYSMKLVGSKNAHQLVSISSDGLFCSWQLDMLAHPIEAITLVNPNHMKTEEIGVTCMDFIDNETSTFLVGTQEGDIFMANRYDRQGIKAGIISSDLYHSHKTVVSGIHAHPLTGSVDFSEVFASSSFDYSVNLWKSKSSLLVSSSKHISNNEENYIGGKKTNFIRPIHTLDVFEDYVYDIKWSPTNPSLLATADGGGNLSIFDFNKDSQVPVIVERGKETPLNKIVFNKTGKYIAAGAVDGNTAIYDLGEMGLAKPEDSNQFIKTLDFMSQQY